ncbi:MAG: hypothetical protein JWO08_1288 [Verrucomicrobiaceae bacterium]|nr:hypothetical protein [Verrucomicrobiaceae bacterium]
MHRFVLILVLICSIGHAATVRTERVPEGGVQPQIVAGNVGILHLVYLTGEPHAADARYASKKPDSSSWSEPITVNSEPHTAVAMGTIRGAQVALGKSGTVHVVWNGLGAKGTPAALFYTRKEPGNVAFEPQRNLRSDTKGLDGGASIAASDKGEVFILWHGVPEKAEPGEQNRVVFMLKSTDNGSSFAPVKIVNPDDLGVCACCSMKSLVTPEGDMLALYRAARRKDQRDVTLLRSTDGGATFQHRIVGTWAISACPMSSMSLAGKGMGVRGAWEAEGKVYTSLLDAEADALVVSGNKARHPAQAVNGKGETLISWSIGTGWQRGGDVGWRLLDPNGRPTRTEGLAKGVPVWGFTAAYADGDGFVVMY